jgi:hypothetical protein
MKDEIGVKFVIEKMSDSLKSRRTLDSWFLCWSRPLLPCLGRNFLFDFPNTRDIAPRRTQRQVTARLTIAATPPVFAGEPVLTFRPPRRPTPLLLKTDSSHTTPRFARTSVILPAIQQPLSRRHRQRRDFPQQAAKKPPRQVALRQ